jgi:uncharacterized membrane protein
VADEDESTVDFASDLGRTVAFTDGVFAIAITLLVLSIDVPDGFERQALGDFIREVWPQFFAYFLSFAVIGRFWVSHHGHFAMLGAIDLPLVVLNLVYLAFVCLVPYPTDLLGAFNERPVSVALYALVVGIASLLGLVMVRYTRRHSLLVPAGMAWAQANDRAMMVPAIVFLGSIPFAFLIPSWTPYLWLLLAVEGRLRRSKVRKP